MPIDPNSSTNGTNYNITNPQWYSESGINVYINRGPRVLLNHKKGCYFDPTTLNSRVQTKPVKEALKPSFCIYV